MEKRLTIDCIFCVNYAYQFYWCQFCNNYNNHCEILFLTSPFSPFKSSHSMEQTHSHILSILNNKKSFVYFFSLVLNLKIGASEWHFTVYRSTFVKVVTFFHFFSFFLRWCTINVMYSCVATSENAIQLRWIPFFSFH